MNRNDFELLLPVGQKEMALAAIHNGADAIYVGMPGFNARGRSYDFEISELKEIIETCHLYGVKVNLAFNIVIFESELEKVKETILQVLPLKPDALIVQDLGLVRLIRELAPEQVVHASTQMTVTNDLAIELVQDLNIKRFVLGRENSISEIKLIKERTQKELEVFVHGALCVSYSGQCFTSETLGGRSANRGQCAQSCRFSYEMYVDGEKKQLVDKQYLVSPQDLCGISEIPQLMEAGIKSFKVEGRLKSPDYVAGVAKSYANAINRKLKQKPLTQVELNAEKIKMASHYSRGFFPGWLNGVDHQRLVDGSFSAHRGALIGEVVAGSDYQIDVQLNTKVHLENGDGILWAKAGKESEKGGFIFSVTQLKDQVIRIGLSRDILIESDIIGSKVYLNHSKNEKRELTKALTDKSTFKKIPVQYRVQVKENEPLIIEINDGQNKIVAQTDSKLVKAQKRGLSAQTINEELAALGGTVFELNKVEYIGEEYLAELFLSAKELKNLRQSITKQLEDLRRSKTIDGFESGLRNLPIPMVDGPTISEQQTLTVNKLNVLLRTRQQVVDFTDALTKGSLDRQYLGVIFLDFEFGRDYSSSLDLLKQAGVTTGIATTRILKPQEYQNLKIIKSLNPDVILVRNLGAIEYFKITNPFSGQLWGDFSLNVTNHLSADYLLSKGLHSVCVSYDLNAEQVSDLLKSTNAEKLEITIHQAMPSFHMEHCVFAAFLSKGSSYKDCGKPCEKHKVQLKDQFGNTHWIKPDQECRNTMYNAKSQTALHYLPNWQSLGLKNIRYEALSENGSELIAKIQHYIRYLKGQVDLEQTLDNLHVLESYGLSSGNLAKTHEYQARKKDHQFHDNKNDGSRL